MKQKDINQLNSFQQNFSMEKFIARDPKTDNDLIRAYTPYLLQIAEKHIRYALCGRGPEDIVQDVFVKFLELPNRNRYPSVAKIRGFLGTVTNNLCIDVHRSTSIRKQTDVDVLLDLSANDDVFRQVESKDTWHYLVEATDALKENQREMFYLLATHDKMQYKDIAEIMGMPLNTTLSVASYMRKNLRKSLNVQ